MDAITKTKKIGNRKSTKSQIPLGFRSHGTHARGRTRERQAHTTPKHKKTTEPRLPVFPTSSTKRGREGVSVCVSLFS